MPASRNPRLGSGTVSFRHLSLARLIRDHLVTRNWHTGQLDSYYTAFSKTQAMCPIWTRDSIAVQRGAPKADAQGKYEGLYIAVSEAAYKPGMRVWLRCLKLRKAHSENTLIPMHTLARETEEYCLDPQQSNRIRMLSPALQSSNEHSASEIGLALQALLPLGLQQEYMQRHLFRFKARWLLCSDKVMKKERLVTWKAYEVLGVSLHLPHAHAFWGLLLSTIMLRLQHMPELANAVAIIAIWA